MKQYFFYPQRETGGAGGGGAADKPILPPSFKDIEPKPGDPIYDPEKQQDPGFQPDKDKTPILDPNKPDTTKVEPIKEPAPEGKKYNEAGELIDDPDYKKPDANPVDDTADDVDPDEIKTFFEEVDKRTGLTIPVEYPEGVDPLTPEGIAIRELAVRQHAVDGWENKVKTNWPHAYAYFLHHMEGGSDEAFFKPERGMALPERASVEESAEIQTQIVKHDLITKGVDSEVADAHVASLIKKNLLKDNAIKIHETRVKERDEELKSIESRQADENKKVDAVIATMSKKIDAVTADLGFVIPEVDKTKVKEYIENNLTYSRQEGKFYVNQEINPDDMKAVMDALVFQFYKGDLTKLVQRKVLTKATQRLKTQADKTKTSHSAGDPTKKTDTSYVPFGELGT